MERIIEEETFFRGIFEASVEGILVADQEGAIVKTNTSLTAMFGYEKDELNGRKIEVLIPQQLRNIHATHRRYFAKNAEVRTMGSNLDLWGLKKDGSKFPLEISLSPSFIENRHMVVAYVMDISKRTDTELKLKQSLEKNSAILRALPDLIFVVSKERIYIDVHSSNLEILRVMQEQLVGKSIYNDIPPDLLPKVKHTFDTVARTQQSELLQYSYERNGAVKFYESRIVPKGDGEFLVVVRDTSDYMEAEKNLFLKDRALESAVNAIVIVDALQKDMPIIYANEAFEKMTGYTKEEVSGANCRFLQKNDRQQKEIEVLRRAIDKGAPCEVELRNYKKDGSLFWNQLTITPIKNGTGTVTHFIGVQNDITSRKKDEFLKEQSSRALEMIAKHQALNKIANHMVATVENQMPQAMVSLLALDRTKNTLHKLSAPKIPKTFTDRIEGIAIGKTVGSCGTAAFLKEEVIVSDIEHSDLWRDHKDLALANNLRACWSLPILSSTKHVLGTFAVYHEKPKKPSPHELKIIVDASKLMAIALEQHETNAQLQNNQQELKSYADKLEDKVRDRTNELSESIDKLMQVNSQLEIQIEETKLAELKALTSQALYLAIAQHFPNGMIAVIDQDYKVISLHGEDLRRFGLQKEKIESQSVDSITQFAPDRLERIKKNVRATLAGNHLSEEIEMNGITYTLNSIPLYNDLKKATQALFVYSNITERKNTEREMLNALAKEKELNELKSRFLSMASHEFRTPLSTILSSATLIEKLNKPGNEEKRVNYAARIKTNVRNLVSILNDFLSLGKLEEGKISFHSQHLDVVAHCRDLLEEFENNKKEGQKLRLTSEKIAIYAFVDEKLLRHIIQNLVSNAIKYSQEHETINVTIAEHGNTLSIAVTDTGIGIPKNEQAKLFERFFRAQNATNIQGTGLGLHIVKKYVELMDGTLSFTSQLNVGSTFTVTLPK
ncbi:MAG: hypothetical protein CMC08_07335 [Flavobacteriaceae bacterium]|nr:hypothetical protein [Flavobacteriaceae bacterium]